MKTIIKIGTILLIAVTFMSCGTSSYMVVRERPTSPYYDRPVWQGPGYYRAYPPRRYYSPYGWHHRNGGYYNRRGRWHR